MVPPASYGVIDRSTQDIPRVLFDFVYEIFTLYDWQFHVIPLSNKIPYRNPTTSSEAPCGAKEDLGSYRFALRYSGNHYYFLFLTLLRCFSLGGFLRCNYTSINRNFYCRVANYEVDRVSPFGHRRITGSWLLPGEFRRHARPSSVSCTKTSTVCVSKRLVNPDKSGLSTSVKILLRHYARV